MKYLDLEDLAKEYETLKEQDANKDLSLDEDEQARLAALRALDDQLFCDMAEYAENESTMIPVGEFEDYAKDLAYDVGYAERDDHMTPYIDWERWAQDVAEDYTEVEFEGTTYLIRAY